MKIVVSIFTVLIVLSSTANTEMKGYTQVLSSRVAFRVRSPRLKLQSTETVIHRRPTQGTQLLKRLLPIPAENKGIQMEISANSAPVQGNQSARQSV